VMVAAATVEVTAARVRSFPVIRCLPWSPAPGGANIPRYRRLLDGWVEFEKPPHTGQARNFLPQ
jgi:hypothetical protein